MVHDASIHDSAMHSHHLTHSLTHSLTDQALLLLIHKSQKDKTRQDRTGHETTQGDTRRHKATQGDTRRHDTTRHDTRQRSFG